MENTNRSKHILVVPSAQVMTKHYPLGGIFEFNQAKVLAEAGYKVGVISLNLDSMRFLFSINDSKDFEIIHGIPVFRSNKKIFSIVRLGRHIKYILKTVEAECDKLFERYVAKYGMPDLIHAHDPNYGAYYAYYANQKYGIPYIVTWHSSNVYEEYNHKISNIELETRVLKNALKVIAVSKAVAKALSTRYGLEDVHVGFNVLEPEFEYCKFSFPIKQKDTFNFISIGSLDKNKNHELLISSFSQAFKGGNFKLSIGGTGHLLAELNNLVIKLGMQEQVEFLGHLNREQVVNSLRISDCLVLSSNHETFGVVLIEALSMGIPVISTRCGGAEDIVNQANGLLVDKKDPDSMKLAMQAMVKGRDNYSSEELRSQTLNRYGSAAFIKDIAGLFPLR
jgi:glycosyltransferase involved in cell wall biosynthesis